MQQEERRDGRGRKRQREGQTDRQTDRRRQRRRARVPIHPRRTTSKRPTTTQTRIFLALSLNSTFFICFLSTELDWIRARKYLSRDTPVFDADVRV